MVEISTLSMNRTGVSHCSEPGSRRATSRSTSGLSRYSPGSAGTKLARRWSDHAGWVKSPVPIRAMPLRRAHQARFGSVRSRLQARENFEWMCRSATYVSAATEDPALTEGTRCILSCLAGARCAATREAQSWILMSLRRAQVDHGHLGRRADTNRRSPEAGAVGHVHRHAIHVAEPGHDGLLQPYDQVERRDLAAVGVPGDLQVDPVPGGLVHGDRLVRHEDDGPRGVPVTERLAKVGGITELRTGHVVDSGQIQAAERDPL